MISTAPLKEQRKNLCTKYHLKHLVRVKKLLCAKKELLSASKKDNLLPIANKCDKRLLALCYFVQGAQSCVERTVPIDFPCKMTSIHGLILKNNIFGGPT